MPAIVLFAFAALFPSLAIAVEPGAKRIALLIANGAYKSASWQLDAASRDAQLFADELKRNAFEVDLGQDLTQKDMGAALDGFVGKVTPGTTALFYYNGLGIQVARQTYLIPIDVDVWSEADVKREGISVDAIVAALNKRGASVKIIVVDAARRNPVERRFRNYSAGLAGMDTPEGTLAMYATAPNKVAMEDDSETSLFMNELVKELRAPDISVEEAMMHTRVGVSRASNGEQVPWVSSSLVEPVYLSAAPPAAQAYPPVVVSTPSPAKVAKTDQKSGGPKREGVSSIKPIPVDPPTPIAKSPAQLPAMTRSVPTPKTVANSTPPPQAAAPTPPSSPAAKPEAASVGQTAAGQPAPPPKLAGVAQNAGAEGSPSSPKLTPAPSSQSTAVPNTPTQTAMVKPPAPPPSAPVTYDKPGTTFRDCPDCPEMVVVGGGTFQMGDGATPFDRPSHRVTIAKPFAMGATEVTFADWDRCVTAGGCKFKPDSQGFGEDQHPVINVSWLDAKDYIAWLSRRTGKTYRLPSEAEWEYAARGGTSTGYSWGPLVGVHMANCVDCGSGADSRATMPAKSFQPNAYGLYDMAGNAAEWVEDCWNMSYRNAPKDGSAWKSGDCGQRVLRGGSFDGAAVYAKPSARFRYDADVRYWANGFRLVRDTL